jgi:hypothetical protein
MIALRGPGTTQAKHESLHEEVTWSLEESFWRWQVQLRRVPP